MSRLRPLLALSWRESRFARRRLLLFLSSISLGVAALVATQSFAANLAAGVKDESRALLGADVAFSSNRPFGKGTTALLDSLARARVPVARATTFASMALLARTGGTRLAQVRAVEPGFPFYGEIETAPAGRWAELQRGGRDAVADPALLTALGAQVGDSISLGEARFRIAATLEKVPGDVGIGSIFAPRVYIPARHVAATRLLRFGSRAEYEAFIRLPDPRAAATFVESHRPLLRGERTRARTAEQQQLNLDRALQRLADFIGLVGTFALLLGGIGVASAMGAYMAQKRETVAALRCLGATAGQVIAVYLFQAAAMGLVGAAIGAVLGVGIQSIIPRLLADFVPFEIRTTIEPAALATGVGIGVLVAGAFALLPLLAIRSVSPLETLRRRVEPEPLPRAWRDPPRLAAWLLLAGSILGLVYVQVGDLTAAALLTAGIAGALFGLWLAAWLVTRLVRRLRTRGMAYPARQGIANLHRPGNQTRIVVLALGFGVFLLATVYLVQQSLLAPLRVNAESRGNLLLFDVQAEQEPGVRAILAADSSAVVQRAPIVPMRIHSINGKTVQQLVGPVTRDTSAEAEEEDGPPQRDERAQQRRTEGRPEA